MPTAKNGFHILNLHPKIYTLKKNILFLMPIYKKNLIIFSYNSKIRCDRQK